MGSVLILPDNDEPGQNYACKIANALLGKVKDLKIVNLPGLQAKEDVRDWAKTSGNTKEKLLEIIENTPAWTPTEKPMKLDETQQNETKTIARFNTTELGNAGRLVEQHGKSIRYCYAWKKWLVWDGKTWRIDSDCQILRLAKDTVKNLYRKALLIADDEKRKSN